MSWQQRIGRRETNLTARSTPVDSPALGDRIAAGDRKADSEDERPEEKEDTDDDQLYVALTF